MRWFNCILGCKGFGDIIGSDLTYFYMWNLFTICISVSEQPDSDVSFPSQPAKSIVFGEAGGCAGRL